MFGLFKRKPACKHSWVITDVWEVCGYTSMVKMFSLTCDKCYERRRVSQKEYSLLTQYGLTKGVDVD